MSRTTRLAQTRGRRVGPKDKGVRAATGPVRSRDHDAPIVRQQRSLRQPDLPGKPGIDCVHARVAELLLKRAVCTKRDDVDRPRSRGAVRHADCINITGRGEQESSDHVERVRTADRIGIHQDLSSGAKRDIQVAAWGELR